MRIPDEENYKTKKVILVTVELRLMSSSGQLMPMGTSFDLLLSAQLTHSLALAS